MTAIKTQKILLINRHPKLAISLPYLKKNVNKILSCLGLKGSGVEITLVNDSFMRRQNLRFMNKKGTTDVLSFPHIAIDGENIGSKKVFSKQYLGDILISLDQAKRQAAEQNISLAKEVTFLVIHSILHLIGHDHGEEADRVRMQEIESRVWKRLYKVRL